MDATLFDTNLSQLLGDPSGVEYTTSMRQAAMWAAVLEYSQYRPALRQIRTGALGQAAVSTATTLLVVGGPFGVGDVLTVGQWPETAEIVVVSGVAPVTSDNVQAVPLVSLTVSPTLYAHGSGAPISAVPSGLQLTTGVTTYPLPLDFIKVEQSSFDLAVGAKARVSRSAGYYDASYGISQSLSGVGYAAQSNYGPTWPSPYGPYPGGPSNNAGPQTFRFIRTGRPALMISPGVGMLTVLDFWYFGSHVVESVPDIDSDALMDLARANCNMALASAQGASGEYKEGQGQYQFSKTAAELLKQHDALRKQFDRKIRLRPRGTSG